MSHDDKVTHYSAYLDERGRLVLPAAVRERLSLSTPDRLVLTFERGNVVRLESARSVARRLRGFLRTAPDRSLVDELVAERRGEAADE